MGRPDKLTPDVVEWVANDETVAAKWKELAVRLGLEAYVPNIDKVSKRLTFASVLLTKV